MRRSLHLNQQSQLRQVSGKWLTQQLQQGLTRIKSPPTSTDYLTWRHHFLQQRLRLGLWLALFWHWVVSIEGLYSVVFEFERLQSVALNLHGDMAIANQWRVSSVVYYIGAVVLSLACLAGQKTAWGQRHPEALFLLFACSLCNLAQVIFAFVDLPEAPSSTLFLYIAVLIPVHWRLHFIYQAISVAFYAIVYPILGMAALTNAGIYSFYSREVIIQLACACSISILSVYLYERLKRSEFEANRRLQIFLHSVSHDLRTPVVGSSIVLKNTLGQATDASNDKITLKRSTVERLLQGSDRQLVLINSLLEAHTAETQGIVLHCEPTHLKPLVDSVLIDLNHILTKKRIQLINHITDDLPAINADANQLWRVFSNLIGNALKHNPHGIQLTIAASLVEPGHNGIEAWKPGSKDRGEPFIPSETVELLCVVQDNGIGIAPEQGQHLFELYARGTKSRYIPGLGLGLYLCKQIIETHGGKIGVTSYLGEGSTFWFTLPLYPTRSQRHHCGLHPIING